MNANNKACTHNHKEDCHSHEHDHNPSHGHSRRNYETYIIENLGCPHCATKMEEKINALPEVEACTIVYTTKQLRLTASDPDSLIDRIDEICKSVESDVNVIKSAAKSDSHTHEHNHSDGKKDLVFVITGALLFIAGEVLERVFPFAAPFVFVAAYIVLGSGILLQAGKNLLKGQIFDENFLMSIATLGAFAINQFAEAVAVMLFFRIGEFFEHMAVERSRSQIMTAVDMRPEVVNLVSDGNTASIPAGDAKVGDILLVRPGDRIPLDGVVISGESRIDTSPITGEPVPVKVTAGSKVISGCVNTSGAINISVEHPLEDSMVTRILDSVENAAASKPKLDRFITRFARVYTPFVLALAVIVAIVPSLITGNWHYWIYTALTFLVICCPCALVLSVPLAFFSGIGAGSRKGILFKGGVTIEALKNVKTVIMDKTGTITKGNFEVNEIVSLSGIDKNEILALAAACETASTHPIAASIVRAADMRGITVDSSDSIKEIAGQGICAAINGVQILCGNLSLMTGNNITVPSVSKNIGTEVFVAKNGILQGYIIISDTIKEEAKQAIASIKRGNRITAMLTGDSVDRASSVAESVGIDEVYAKLLPDDKVNILSEIRQKHGSVMYIGDGINDAPVLAAANVSAAMGSGADAAIEAADVVFMNSSMDSVPQSFSIAKATYSIAIQNIVLALGIKFVVMLLGLMGMASMWMAVFADTGVSFLCVLNSMRILYKKF